MRKVFFSFDWDDVWQANQVRNSWVAKGGYTNAGFVDKAEIEQLKRSSDRGIKKWINEQLQGTSVTCVLIGKDTDKSRWVKYEIEESIKKENGILGVIISGLKDNQGETSGKVANPLSPYSENDFGRNIKHALIGGASGYGLARLLFPQLAVPATIVGIAFALLKPDDDYKIYDWVEDHGYENLGDWIEKAAIQAGR